VIPQPHVSASLVEKKFPDPVDLYPAAENWCDERADLKFKLKHTKIGKQIQKIPHQHGLCAGPCVNVMKISNHTLCSFVPPYWKEDEVDVAGLKL